MKDFDRYNCYACGDDAYMDTNNLTPNGINCYYGDDTRGQSRIYCESCAIKARDQHDFFT